MVTTAAVTDASITNAKIADDAVTGAKLANGVKAIGNYSTSEVATDFTWVDGKTIYRKTVNIGNLPNTTTKSVAHGITTIQNVIRLYGFAKTGSIYVPLPFVSNILTSQITININGANIDVITGSDRSAFTGYIIIEYTKV